MPGIGRKAALKIVAGWRQGRGDRELIAFLGEHGLSPALAARLQKTYGQAALSVVRTNPYRSRRMCAGSGFTVPTKSRGESACRPTRSSASTPRSCTSSSARPRRATPTSRAKISSGWPPNWSTCRPRAWSRAWTSRWRRGTLRPTRWAAWREFFSTRCTTPKAPWRGGCAPWRARPSASRSLTPWPRWPTSNSAHGSSWPASSVVRLWSWRAAGC